MKTEHTIAADHEQVGNTDVIVGGSTYVERAVAALEHLGGKATALRRVGASQLRQMAHAAPDVLAERCDELEQLTEFALTRLRALVEESRTR